MSEVPPGGVVLAVDDEDLVLDLLVSALEEGGFAVRSVGGGREAIEVIEAATAGDFRGLVTDVNLSRSVSGWDVARRARELDPSIPVVYISGDSGHDWEAQGVPKSTLLQKPFASAQLVVALASLMNAQQSDG